MGQPTTFIMESADVLHAFFVPAFRQKQDIVPGRYTSCWVNPTLPGTFRLYCAEYCGDDHSNMRTNCTVHRTEEDRKNATKWDWPTKTPEENGQRLFSIYCSGCHSVTGQVKTGPALDHKFGTEEQVRAGGSLQTVTVDENYVRTSLEEPNRHIVDTFPSPSPMQSFKGQLTDDQIAWLIAYLKSLNP
jgi:cytochrome c oxidase subunit 2